MLGWAYCPPPPAQVRMAPLLRNGGDGIAIAPFVTDIPQIGDPAFLEHAPHPFGRRVSFLAEGVKRDSEESHLLKALSSGGGCTLKRKVRRPC